MKTVGVRNEQAQADLSACGDLPALAADAGTEDKVGTRNRVARLILANGPSTAADLAARLGLTPAAVRRHLDALLAEGLVEAREQRTYGHRGRGRPAKVFALTGDGRSVFHHTYDELAIDALRFIAQSGGDSAVDAFARSRFSGLAERYRAVLAGADPADRPRLLADALTADGYAASTRSTAAVSPAGASAHAASSGTAAQDTGKSPIQGAQVCQHHCPVQHVAEEFPQLCEAETQLFAELLGTHVQRLATIAHGDGVCTTFIPGAVSVAERGAGAAAGPGPDHGATRAAHAAPGAPETDFDTNAPQSEGASA